MLQRLIGYSRNFYVATGVGLLVWMCLFDASDLPSQFRNWQKLRELESERVFYLDDIKLVKQQQRDILGSARLRETYARERYLMKKPTEDVFVIVDENGQPIEK